MDFQEGMKDGMPICMGYFTVSFTFGITASSVGLSPLNATLISLTNLTSAGQFAGLSVLAAGAPFIEMAITQLIINLRYLLMSFSLSQKLESKTSLLSKLLISYAITDEIFGVSSGKEGKVSKYYIYGLMCVAVPGWTIGTLLGAISGNLMPPILGSALGIAIYGMFLAIIIPPAKRSKPVCMVVILSMLISFCFYVVPVFKQVSSGLTIIITTILVAGSFAYLYPIEEEKNGI